ncbi:DNA recombination/repair protein [Cavenderia fasciculata]|uniref:DNA repair protein RAD50 n=1 Tax=Cavenderia fasciculata TaxID=261658 RepID=F4PXH9_CACFS|nr:DNA recombination/repair protein [Cavenderia fasciculata]EGG19489.1 DNA recombination/repair protein [Cavenderia fasciculata]|eukprot:XP_004357783.1 DNA recombination/repair protein [Cavenderia fasciculata]
MTSVEKILIQGIRSFDYKEPSVIDFYKPLTLIVGVNGAGKTTIIECLKYASTGEMPPNCSNGQAFIHDPKIAGEAEVKAQIKLRFKTPNGKPIVAARSMSLIQKPHNKQEFRQIDSSLQSFNNDGQKVSKSYRCSDLDKEIPELMGAAKPVLKNVIFCHQEESNWPLSESAKLKVKFDEIFSAVRYTKALKSIKDKKKELNTQLKEFKLKLEVVDTNREHAHRLTKEVKQMENQVVSLKDSIQRMNEQLGQKREIVEKIARAMKNVDSVISEVQVMEARKNEMERNKNQIYNSLVEVFEEPDEELVFMIKGFDEEVNRMHSAYQELSENQARLVQEKEQAAREMNRLAVESGQAKASLTTKKKNEQERDAHISDLVKRYHIINGEDDTNPSIDQLLGLLATKFQEINSMIEEDRKSNQESLSSIQEDLNNQTGKRQTLRERIHQFSTQIDDNNQKLNNYDKERTSVINLNKNLEAFAQQSNVLQDEIEQLEQTTANSNNQSLITAKTEEKKSIEQQMEISNDEIRKMSSHATIISRINQLKKDILSKQQLIDSKLQENQVQLKQILGSNNQPKVNGLFQQLIKSKKELDESLSIKQEEFDDINDQLNRSENELRLYRDELSKKNQQLSTIKPKLSILDQDELKDLSKSISILNLKLHKLEKNYAILESEDILYKEYIEKAHDEKECALCEKELNEELPQFVEKLQQHTHDIPLKLEDIKKEMNQTRKRYEQLEAIKPQYDIYIQLSETEIPQHNKRQEEILKSISSLEPTRQLVTTELNEIKSKRENCNKMLLIAERLDQVQKESLELEADLKSTSSQIQNDSLIDQNETLESKMSRYDQLQKEIAVLSRSIDDLSNQSKKLAETLMYKKQQLLSLKEKLSNQKGSEQILERIKQSEIETNNIISQLTKNLQSTKQEMKELGSLIEIKQKEMQEKTLENETRNRELVQEKTIFERKLHQLRSVINQIASAGDVELKHKTIVEAIETIGVQISTVDQDMATGSGHLEAIKSQLSERDKAKRAITDNLQYRQLKLNIETMLNQIQRKKDVIGSMITAEDAANHKSLSADISVLKSRVDQSTGSVEALEQQKRNLTQELNKPVYKTVDEVYRDLLVQIETLDFVNKDMDKYYKALDKALMKYHTLKMEEINKTIRELWQSTYKGNDIDTIEIRSEEATGAKKTLNYRVVMVKGEVELDMRGRCSAGQKVLACLIIRLALAENFCSSCGILALDEPTSHLDRANIESFATGLLNIIEARKNQRGFQLIIITHDEEFVQYLSRGNFADYYWRVTKDSNQHTSIEKKEISKI